MDGTLKKLSSLTKGQVIVTWIAVLATLLLTAEILWTVGEIWEGLDLWFQIAIIFSTFLVVVMVGWRRSPTQIFK